MSELSILTHKTVENVLQNWFNKIENPIMPKKIIYVGDKTIVLWSDDTKTEVKCVPGEQFSQEGGFAACLVKKMFPNRTALLRMIDEKKEIREPKKRKDYELLDKNS